MDYEFSPSSADINDFVDLLRKVRATLDPGKLLTVSRTEYLCSYLHTHINAEIPLL